MAGHASKVVAAVAARSSPPEPGTTLPQLRPPAAQAARPILNRTGFGGGSGVPRFARSGWWISDGGLRRTVVAPTAFASAQRAPIEFDRIVVAVASDAT